MGNGTCCCLATCSLSLLACFLKASIALCHLTATTIFRCTGIGKTLFRSRPRCLSDLNNCRVYSVQCHSSLKFPPIPDKYATLINNGSANSRNVDVWKCDIGPDWKKGKNEKRLSRKQELKMVHCSSLLQAGFYLDSSVICLVLTILWTVYKSYNKLNKNSLFTLSSNVKWRLSCGKCAKRCHFVLG